MISTKEIIKIACKNINKWAYCNSEKCLNHHKDSQIHGNAIHKDCDSCVVNILYETNINIYHILYFDDINKKNN